MFEPQNVGERPLWQARTRGGMQGMQGMHPPHQT